MLTFSFINIIGWLGSAAVLTAYILISTGRLGSKSITYHLLNLFGGAGLVVNATYYGAYPSAFVNIIWLLIAIAAIARMGPSLDERGRGKLVAHHQPK
jgi:formate hydrogenlyase subunit 3/multisubunit Na+/H+ antiporter MnhD subunit